MNLSNKTGEILLVYGDNPEPENTPGRTDNKLYRLLIGHKTPPNWDCDGFYIPNNRFAEQLVLPTIQGPVAIKYINIQSPSITMSNNTTYYCPGNYSVLNPGEVNWPIPNISYEEVVSNNFPVVPNSIAID